MAGCWHCLNFSQLAAYRTYETEAEICVSDEMCKDHISACRFFACRKFMHALRTSDKDAMMMATTNLVSFLSLLRNGIDLIRLGGSEIVTRYLVAAPTTSLLTLTFTNLQPPPRSYLCTFFIKSLCDLRNHGAHSDRFKVGKNGKNL